MGTQPIRVTLVRHGQSEANLSQRWQGQGDSPLTEYGQQQARLVGQRLSKRTYTRVVASDLQRASETARATGFAFERNPAFREFDIGAWEGLTREQVEERFPDEMQRLKHGEDVPLGGGESYAAFARRIDEALSALRSDLEPGDHALVVCHGGVIAAVLSGALGLRDSRGWALARVANTAITELAFTDEGALLHVFNDTLHLRALGEWPAHADVAGMVGLVCEALPEAGLGAFAAHYDAAPQLSALGPSAGPEACAALLSNTVTELSGKHPVHRVALSAHGPSIHAWAEAALFRGVMPKGALVPPRPGSVSHVAMVGERLLLLDYGLSP